MSKLGLIFLIVLFAACSSRSVPKNIIQPDSMMVIVYDMIRADEFVNSYVLRDTALKNKEEHIKMYEQVFKIHHINRDVFYKSFKYYQEHPDVNKVMFDSLLSHTNRIRKTLYEEKPGTKSVPVP